MGLRADTPVQYIKGVGPRRAERLEKLGIRTVEELLFHLPFRYIDRSNPVPVSSAETGKEATFVVKVLGASFRRTRKGPLVQILVSDSSAQMYVVWFNRPDLKGKFKTGETLLVSGQLSFWGERQMVNPFFEHLDDNPCFFERPIFPVYPLTEGLAAWEVRKAVSSALDGLEGLPETLPGEIMESRGLQDIMSSLESVHHPRTMDEVEPALARLRYEELFYFETLVAIRRRRFEEDTQGEALASGGKLTLEFVRSLPFELTGDQRKAMGEISGDIKLSRPMHRLLQGDVGSGKTVVALYAMLCAVEARKQAAMMAPTEILAEQHYDNWSGVLERIGVKTALLTGSAAKREREKLRSGIEQGDVDAVFGTHALIEEDVQFSDLALAVVDEQHRFGVMQRAALSKKGSYRPHVLVMSATPIPRTLTLSYYGDLDVSVIREKPKGRAQRKTELTSEARKEGVWRWLKESLEHGERAYVVCPLIDESEKLELSSAKKTFDELSARLGADRVALLHGRLKADERTMAMEKFKRGEVPVLVSTTVIEVGVDVPEATIMIIFHPERFGLAQLHQLRGRVGRGERPSRCILVAAGDLAPESVERLKFFASTEDGFALAEEDLRLRGPGQIMGTRQHGLPDLRIADLARDRKLLLAAREDAFRMLKEDPMLAENPRVAQTIRRRHSEGLKLAGTG